jgi:protein required for attachment to host cells
MTKSIKKPDADPDGALSERSWIVVADGRKARVFRKDTQGSWELLDQIISTRDHHLKHKPPHIDSIHADDAAFIREVGVWLEEHAGSDSFDKFVLMATPKHLPHFRQSFSEPLQARLHKEID